MNRLKKLAGNNLNRQTFKQITLDNGFIPIDENGELNFVVTQINIENFNDISPNLQEQLENENKYNSWIGFISYEKQSPYSVQMLPIYGNSQEYITRWFTNTAEEAIDQCLNDRSMKLLKRANTYRENNL